MAVDLFEHTDRVDAYTDPLPAPKAPAREEFRSSVLARRGNPLSRRTLRDGSLGDPFPGTSCQATIVKSLRDAAPP
jgi:hypothetical protein